MSKSRIDIPGKGLVQFEYKILPEGAKYFEYASFYSSLAEDIKEWILDLRYAWGRERRADSSLVLRACDEIEHRIYSERDALLGHLRDTIQKGDPAELCREWLTAIQMMRECAETRETCAWTVLPIDGEEVAHWLAQIIGLLRAREKAQEDPLIPPGFVEHMKGAPEEDQLRFINKILDSLNHHARN